MSDREFAEIIRQFAKDSPLFKDPRNALPLYTYTGEIDGHRIVVTIMWDRDKGEPIMKWAKR